MKKSTVCFLFGTGTALSALGLSSTFLAAQLVSIALDRQSPLCARQAKLRLSGSPSHRILLEHLDQAAAQLEGLPCQTVRITARDGTPLVGHWYPSQEPRRIILAMHGWRSTWAKDFGAVAAYWHSQNCSVLFAEQRGQNESGGSYMGFGMLERYDCLDWIGFLQTVSAPLPIYLCGVSMGATTVLMAAGLNLPPSVHGIIADCGFTSPHEIWRHVVRNNLHFPYALCGSTANYFCKKRLHVGTRDCSTVAAMKRCRVPVLFVHGTDDRFVPIEMTFQNYKACAAPKHLFIVPGAEHGMSYFIDPNGYQTAVETFWQQYDTKEESRP